MENNTITENEELLKNIKDIREYSKKRLFWGRISAAMIIIFTAANITTLPIMVRTFNTVNNTFELASDRLESLTATIGKVDNVLDSLSKMTNDTSESLQESMENLNKIDFDGLNKAIEDLGDVVEPLANFFGKFSR